MLKVADTFSGVNWEVQLENFFLEEMENKCAVCSVIHNSEEYFIARIGIYVYAVYYDNYGQHFFYYIEDVIKYIKE